FIAFFWLIYAASPELYSIVAEQTRPISLLLGILAHENTYTSSSVINLLHKLFESTCLQEAGLRKVNKFLEVLFSGQIIQLLMQDVSRLDETKKNEADGLHETLGIVETLLEIRPDMNMTIANQGIFSWRLRRLRKRPVFDKNKLYVSEFLSVLLQINLSK
ncbi:Beta-catenin-like protein 1, partial [Schistosoma japonicum]